MRKFAGMWNAFGTHPFDLRTWGIVRPVLARKHEMSSIGLTEPILAAPSKRRVEVIWADRTALYVAIGWAAFLLIGWLMAAVACGVAGACLLAKDTAILALEIGLVLVLTAWFALTGLDFLFKGPARRKARSR
jgi:hypothetical protein